MPGREIMVEIGYRENGHLKEWALGRAPVRLRTGDIEPLGEWKLMIRALRRICTGEIGH